MPGTLVCAAPHPAVGTLVEGVDLPLAHWTLRSQQLNFDKMIFGGTFVCFVKNVKKKKKTSRGTIHFSNLEGRGIGGSWCLIFSENTKIIYFFITGKRIWGP